MSKKHFLEFEHPIAELESRIEELRYVQNESAVDISDEIDRLSQKSQQLTKDIYSSLSPWQVTHLARHPPPPYPFPLYPFSPRHQYNWFRLGRPTFF